MLRRGIAVAGALLALGCGGSRGAAAMGPPAEVVVSMDVDAITTWSPTSIYRVTRVLAIRSHLTILPGTTVRFDADGGLSVQTGGVLQADGGAPATPIVFTSSASAPAGGDWRGIALGASGSTLRHCQVLYAGAGDAAALAIDWGSTATVANCTLAHHRTPTTGLTGKPALDASRAGAGTVIRDNVFYDDGKPLAVNVAVAVEPNAFDDGAASPGNPRPSTHNAVFVAGCGHVEGATAWPTLPVPYVIGDPACSYLVIDAGAHLTLRPDVALKFHAGGAVFVDHGALFSLGVTARLTSIRDDWLTDTNGDGSATAPATGDWYGVKYYHSGADPTCDQNPYLHYQLPNTQGSCAW